MQWEIIRVAGVENAYIVKADGHVALVDTMAKQSYRKLLKALERNGVAPRDIELVLITHHHFDHAANVRRIKELSGATIVAGVADAAVLERSVPIPGPSGLNRIGRLMGKLPRKWVDAYQYYDNVLVDRKVNDGDIIEELGLEVVALPGHTAGGVAYLDRKERRAFTGDMASNYFGRPGMPALVGSEDLSQIFESQERLAALDLETAYPGHGRVIRPHASATIGEMSRHKKRKLLKQG